MAQMTTNGRPRKQLSEQIDRLEQAVGGLGLGLREAVREAATQAVLFLFPLQPGGATAPLLRGLRQDTFCPSTLRRGPFLLCRGLRSPSRAIRPERINQLRLACAAG
jgi:hypothetical protein